MEGHGKPLGFLLTPGQQHDSTVFDELMRTGAVRHSRRRARNRPRRLVADKAYSSNAIRHSLARRGIRATIPRRKDEMRPGPFNREAYRQRNLVERCINRLKQYRRIATRYEKLASNYLAMITVAAIMLWL